MNKSHLKASCGLILGWACALLMPSISIAAPATVDRVAALVGTQVITQRQWDQRIERVRQQNPGKALPSDLGDQVLEVMIGELAQVQAALDMGLSITEEDVDQAEQRLAAQNGVSLDEFQKSLGSRGVSRAGLRASLRDQLLIERAKERVVTERVELTPGAIQDYIQAKATDFPEMINLAHIVVRVPEKASAAQRAQALLNAKSLVARARSGAAFESLLPGAASVSLADRGGALGLKPEADYPPLFVQATRGLSVGSVSEVVESGAGYHVLKVLQREPARKTVAEPQAHVRHILLRAENDAQRRGAVLQLQKIRADMLAGRAEFSDMARRFSQDGSAAIGGDLGWAGPGYFVPEFEAAVDTLAIDAVSEPLVTRFGVHLLQVLERRQQLMDDAALQAWAKKQLRAELGAEVLAAWVREARAAAFVQRMGAQ